MDFLSQHWDVIATIAYFAGAVLNMASKYFTKYEGATKWIMAAVEFFSFLSSKELPGLFKLPFTLKPPGGKPPIPGLSALLLILLIPGCASWQQGVKSSLDIAGTTLATIQPLAVAHYGEKCRAVAVECAKAQDSACPELITCQEERHAVYLAISSGQMARLAGYGALQISDEKTAREKAAAAAQIAADLFKALTVGGAL